jgi:hypothetical protein
VNFLIVGNKRVVLTIPMDIGEGNLKLGIGSGGIFKR